jgi:putative transposase
MLHLRYARWDLTHVDLVDPRTGALLCPVKPLDKSANADGQRRRLRRSRPICRRCPRRPASRRLLRQLLADYAATGLPPAYLPSLDQDPA